MIIAAFRELLTFNSAGFKRETPHHLPRANCYTSTGEPMQSSFLSKLRTEHVKGKVWKLIAPLTFRYGWEHITAPAEFHTDFASIKGTLITIFGRPSGKSAEPAVIHDYLYSKKADRGEQRSFTRKECDEVFLEAMEVRGVNWFRRHGMYHGVRLFGARYFRQ